MNTYPMHICGDVNGRTDSLNDYINYVDELPPRVCIDTVKNQHGQSFVDFYSKAECALPMVELHPSSMNLPQYPPRAVQLLIKLRSAKSVFKTVLNVKFCVWVTWLNDIISREL